MEEYYILIHLYHPGKEKDWVGNSFKLHQSVD